MIFWAVRTILRVNRNNPSARTLSLPPSVCGHSVGGALAPYYLDHLPLPLPRTPCPPNITHPLPISSVGTTVLAGRSARAPSVSFLKVCGSSYLFPVIFPNLGPLSRTRDEPPQLADRRHQVCPSKLILVHVIVSIHRPDATSVQEPRKAEAPQLRDECRSYRILSGCRQCNSLAF